MTPVRRAARPLAVSLALLSVLVVGSITSTSAQDGTSELFAGSVPVDAGGMALVAVHGETEAGVLVGALRDAGCEPALIALASEGTFLIYAPAAPAFANASFPTPLEAGRIALVRCAPPEVPDAHLLRLVSKGHPLPADYVPEDLVSLPPEIVLSGTGPAYVTGETAEALERMLAAARGEGHELVVRSAYRSYQEQVATHQYWVDVLGEAEANRRSALAGESEHQLGTVVDVTSASVAWDLVPEFGDTPEGEWLAEHAAEFGFVISYPEDAEEVTGYEYEPWHLRYIGTLHADWLAQTGLTLTEYLEQVDVDFE